MKKGIIFDVDGTLWDSSENVAKAWNTIIEKRGIARPMIVKEDIQGVMGKPMDKVAEILLPELPKIQREQILEECCAEENAYLRQHGGELYEGVEKTFAALQEKGYRLYIVSNCQKGYIEALLDFYQLWDYVEDTECYGNNLLQKGDNIRLVVERNQLEAAVYVGDIQGDYDASSQAGIPFIHAAYGYGKINVPVPAIQSFEELAEMDIEAVYSK